MSIQTTALKYGWAIAAGAILTGTTIYVADSTQKRITQRDAVEVILGTVERCYATQITTNPTYSVDPPSFVRSWVSTNGLTGTNFAWVTNQVTNTISWYTDRNMMIDLDAKIFALIPYYVDPDSVYDGTTNIVMLTVTGLFASLQIGNHTNQFTAIPCWTNNVGTTNCTTNAATFGPWAWRNYVVAWQERYKVLNALKMTKPTLPGSVLAHYSSREAWYAADYISLYDKTVAAGVSSHDTTWYPYLILFYYANYDGGWSQGYIYNASFKFSSLNLSTQIQSSVYVYFLAHAPYMSGTKRFDDNGYGLVEEAYNLLDAGSLETNTYVLFNPETAIPASGSTPTNNAEIVTGFWGNNLSCYVNWQFNYCTNRFW